MIETPHYRLPRLHFWTAAWATLFAGAWLTINRVQGGWPLIVLGPSQTELLWEAIAINVLIGVVVFLIGFTVFVSGIIGVAGGILRSKTSNHQQT